MVEVGEAGSMLREEGSFGAEGDGLPWMRHRGEAPLIHSKEAKDDYGAEGDLP